MRFELVIEGMLAVHAKHAVFSALGAVEGIVGAEVELGRAVVDFGASEGSGGAREEALRAAVDAAGYRVREVRILPRTLPTL